jgi:hypothetical protein
MTQSHTGSTSHDLEAGNTWISPASSHPCDNRSSLLPLTAPLFVHSYRDTTGSVAFSAP